MINPDNPNFDRRFDRAMSKINAHDKFIEIASNFREVSYPPGQAGLQLAINDMFAQRNAINIPAIEPYSIYSMVAHRDPLIRNTSVRTISAVSEGDYATAFVGTNRLHLFAKASQKDLLDSGEAFLYALDAQRTVADKTTDYLLATQPHLSEPLHEIKEAITRGPYIYNRDKEYKILRQITHDFAYSGALGSDVRNLFDPFAFQSTQIVTGYE